jgi:hypothetical protein
MAEHDTRQALPPLPTCYSRFEHERGMPLYSADQMQAYAIAALAAQPVAGAVAQPVAWCALTPSGKIAYFEGKPMVMPGPVGNELHPHALILAAPQPQAAPAPEPSAQAVREPGDPLHDDAYVRGVAVGFVEDDSRRTTLLRIADRMQKLAAAPQPAPSAQAVAHPSHQTVREWMPVSEALRLSDLWTAGDLDNCGQWRAAIKVLADEVRALAASPQPEPSAQGEPVACDRDAPVCPWCDRQGWDICQHADDARTCGK